MCGISFLCRQNLCPIVEDGTWDKVVACNRLRGPDHDATQTIAWPGRDVRLAASVLGLRGKRITPQPLTGASGHLAWNGQIFGRLDSPVASPELESTLDHLFRSIEAGANDGQALIEAVDMLAQSSPTYPSAIPALTDILDNVDGPFAFCFVSPDQSWVAYGRDSLGRRSLLHSMAEEGRTASDFILTSCGTAESHLPRLYEVPCDRYFMVRCGATASELTITGIPRRQHKRTLPSATDIPDPLEPPGQGVVEELVRVLRSSVASRLPLVQCRNDHDGNGNTYGASTAILFSGGLDCTTLASLTHDRLGHNESIDLLNVAFETAKPNQHPTEGVYGTPDRLTALEAYDELCRLHPQRRWRLVRINVTREEYAAHRTHVVDCMAPNDTVMDLSITVALYFAARAQGYYMHDEQPVPYTTEARVLLSGLGADELFGGYQRHRLAHKRLGWTGLSDELQRDLDRLPERNLGRDDRVISSTGREVRFPFLSPSVLEFACRLPVYQKAFYGDPEAAQDKRLLRDVAYSLGLHVTAERAKRAIQFGARSAKLGSTLAGPKDNGGKYGVGERKVQR